MTNDHDDEMMTMIMIMLTTYPQASAFEGLPQVILLKQLNIIAI